MWILIILLGGVGIEMQEFNTKGACEEASQWITENKPSGQSLKLTCKPKGYTKG